MGYAELTLIAGVCALVMVAGFVAILVVLLDVAGAGFVVAAVEALIDVVDAEGSGWGFLATG